MNIPNRSNARARRRHNFVRFTFRLSNFFGDPFAISSVSIATIAWIITIAGAIASAADSESFPRFTWWGIAYQIMMNFVIFIIYCYDLIGYYKTFLAAASAVSFIYNTNSATNLVYSSGPRKAASSAGVILLSIVNLIWVFYFGSDNASPTNRWVDSFSLRGIRPSAYELALIRSIRRRTVLNNERMSSNDVYNNIQDNLSDNNLGYIDKTNQYMSSHDLTGLESTNLDNPSVIIPYNDNPADDSNNVLPAVYHDLENYPNNENVDTFITDSSNGNTETTMGDTLDLYSDIGTESFPYTAKALYSYQADDADGYEISFEQGEILKVSDIEGRWWKSKRENGQVGIIPSNYVQLIED
ncbi:hypothetical protein TPHA_0K00680 [Tetrapisispora phaffii CBS 4417]|uniref:High osmolarity signaling protein SHO1 n=1 Tax=Tetrapisispora phaffii (strain ATCC 24235 / CBS 4417 / NBRC 1672 / NRRL Y-8282 / UCD 70-5) TaxID=1071381 RepID=G8BZ74_TETPH|nr:hypothetical protein TPHA_0K00680 [Tetrapisispora phaffii CBS 4417]CCE65202.1 hypothetical protein TPHA_0K00680 [Tetrapisispora phaffii CBS 4417]